VTAVANSGSHFVNWSDGVTTATRTDTNVVANKSVTANFAPDVVGTATLAFEWWSEGYADLHVENASGVTIASTTVEGYDSDLSWYVTVPAGQSYYMVCDYYDDYEYGGTGGGYGRWSYDTEINPDGVLSPGETVTWQY
jgi:hypothetical protein